MKRYAIQAAVAVTVLALVAASSYFWGKRVADYHARMAQLEQQLDAKQKEFDTLKSERKHIEQDTASQVAATRTKYTEAAHTQQGAINAVNAAIPALSLTNANPGALPDTPSAALIPAGKLPVLLQYISDSDANRIELDGCRKVVANLDKQVCNLEAQKTNLTEQRDEVKRAKGLGAWNRVKNCGARIVIGGIAGALSKDRKNAGIGAGIGAGSCLLF